MDDSEISVLLHHTNLQYKYMVLTETALQSITPKTRIKLAVALECTEQWIIKLIAANKPNGPLTTYAALKVIREDSGLTDESLLMGKKEELLGEQN